MKIGILTYYFAYNYGAMLQAYALKNELVLNGVNVEIIPYFPQFFKSHYSINPFEKNISFKHRVSNLLRYQNKRKQIQKFDEFRDALTNGKQSIENEFESYCLDVDCIVYGSDQIWNTNINNDDSNYFGSNYRGKKVSYAASIGSSTISDVQREYIDKFLRDFQSISVREPSSVNNIKKILELQPKVVCDPVFFLKQDGWKEIEKSMDKISDKYVLVYMLEENNKLLDIAIKYAEANGLKIYEIHPTLSFHNDGCKHLFNVGPQEFVYLVNHANVVCTNSFHCVAFSMIFNKKLFHIPNSNSPERTISLLRANDIQLEKLNKENPWDVSISSHFKDQIEESRNFLFDLLINE